MKNQKFKESILTALQGDTRLWNDGTLNQSLLFDLVDRYDESIINLLLQDESIKGKFFIVAGDAYVFKLQDFKFFLDENSLDNSYTQYENKIGLRVGNKLLKERSEVVLNFPFKDCVLEGGQSRDEGVDISFEYDENSQDFIEQKSKRKEIFFNEILARDEIDRLEEPKALKNWKRFTKNGEEAVGSIKRDEDGVIRENLIIKGNNLLALHSIKQEFAGKVKLVYIDPPYNTGADSFKYNDNFNHSTWLTFMKNRLDIAKELLREDGIIFVQCDGNEQAYLKVLMDDIFGRENLAEIITVVNNPRGRDYGGIANMHEFILVYRNSFLTEIYPLLDEEKEFPFEDDISGFEIRELRNRNTKFNSDNRPNLCYPFYVNLSKTDSNGFYEIALDPKEGFKEVFPAKSEGIQTVWRWGKDKARGELNVNIVGKAMKEEGRFQIVEKYRKKTAMARSVWWDKEVNSERGTLHLKELFNGKVFNNPKPEETLSRIIEIATLTGDIVLDYHLGSGTTTSVAHKMGRQYIGMEQMDYIKPVSVERMRKVINGEQGGISKASNWQGGGEFIYFELAEWNEEAKRIISEAESLDVLVDFLDQLCDQYFLDYNVKVKDFREEVLPDENFQNLSLERQKEIFLKMLDLNQMYVNFTEREDEKFGLSQEDIGLSEEFYKN